MGASEHIFKARQNLVQGASSIFPWIQPREIASMNVVSHNGQPLCGFLLYGSTDRLRPAGVPVGPASATPVYLCHIASQGPWWTGIGLVNAGDVPADISFSLFNEDGDLLDLRMQQMYPNQHQAITLEGLFGDGDLASIIYG